MTTTAERILDRLSAYDLQREGDNEYRCNSPLRPGANSHSFKLTIDPGGENGAYYDHTSHEKGSLYGLADVLRIEHPDGTHAAELETTKRAYRDLADYAQAHGVTADVLTKRGWSDVATHDGRPALLFKTPTGKRYRFTDGEKPYYKSEYGYKACWYGLVGALDMTTHHWQPLVICNGEVSTLVGQHYGVAACCVTSGEKTIPAALLDELNSKYNGAIVLAFDCDTVGRETARKVKAQFPAGRDVSIVDFKLGTGGDLADFCKLHGAAVGVALAELIPTAPTVDEPSAPDALTALVAAIDALQKGIRADDKARKAADVEALVASAQAAIDRVQSHSAAAVVQSIDELAAANITLLDYALANPDPVRGLRSRITTLDKAIGGFTPGVYVVLGATNMGKSTFAVSLAREFITQGAGLIVPTESNPYRWLTKLVAAICKIPSDRIETGMLSADEAKRVRDAYGNLKSHRCDFLKGGSPTPNILRAAALAGDYKWLIVDSISRMAAPGTHNIYDQTSAVADGVLSLSAELDIPVVCTAQVGRDLSARPKGMKMPQINDAYGSGKVEQNADVVLGLYNHQYYVDQKLEDESIDMLPDTAVLKLLKNRWGGGSRRTGVKLAFVGGCGHYELETRNFNDLPYKDVR